MPRLWIRRLAGLSMVALALLSLIFSLHGGSCTGHDHDHEGDAGGEPTHLVCHCACHAVTVPEDVTPSFTMTPVQPVLGAHEQDAIVSVVLEVDPPPDKRSA
jgi:hypothetical protein